MVVLPLRRLTELHLQDLRLPDYVVEPSVCDEGGTNSIVPEMSIHFHQGQNKGQTLGSFGGNFVLL